MSKKMRRRRRKRRRKKRRKMRRQRRLEDLEKGDEEEDENKVNKKRRWEGWDCEREGWECRVGEEKGRERRIREWRETRRKCYNSCTNECLSQSVSPISPVYGAPARYVIGQDFRVCALSPLLSLGTPRPHVRARTRAAADETSRAVALLCQLCAEQQSYRYHFHHQR